MAKACFTWDEPNQRWTTHSNIDRDIQQEVPRAKEWVEDLDVIVLQKSSDLEVHSIPLSLCTAFLLLAAGVVR